MKKLIALLLVLCLTVGLVACAKPATDPTGNTTGSSNNNPTGGGSEDGNGGDGNMEVTTPSDLTLPDVTSPIDTGDSEEPNSNDKYINPDFAGKTLQIWGISGAAFDDIENMGNGSFLWMMRAAVADWAALNDVTIEYCGDYNMNQIQSSINNGDKPDLLLMTHGFPVTAIQGIVRAFTEEEYKQLAGIIGNRYLDMIKYKGEAYGLQYPWGGNDMFYFNQTMFENYDVKTPLEYYMEDNWTWDTMVECWKAITKDLDGDGVNDTYGTGRLNDVFDRYGGAPVLENEDGTISAALFDTEQYRRYREIYYEGLMEEGYIQNTNALCTVSKNPRPGTHANDCEWYNFAHLVQTSANGDVIIAIPHPLYKQGDTESTMLSYTQYIGSIFSTCDENEATLSLLSYILKVGMRYMSDFSLGLYKCEYESIRGACDYSATWKEYFKEVCEYRVEDFEAIEEYWDNDYFVKMMGDMFTKPGFFSRSYPGMEVKISEETDKMPPASAIPLIKAAYEAACNTFNSLYAY